MKRLICTILILCLLPVCVCAEYEGKTDEELKEDFITVVSELVKRGIWLSDTIPAGLYVVGISIPAGAYEFSPVKFCSVEMYASKEAFVNREKRIFFETYDEGNTFILTLDNEVYLNLGATCSIKPLGFSW